jgi:hypothetical protein
VVIRSVQQLTGYEALIKTTAGKDFSVGPMLRQFEANIKSVEAIPCSTLFWKQMASIIASAPQLDDDHPNAFISTSLFRAPQVALAGVRLVSLHVLVHTDSFEEIPKINVLWSLDSLSIAFAHTPHHDAERILEPIRLDSLTMFEVSANGESLEAPSVFRYLGLSRLGSKCSIRLQSITPSDLVHLDNLFVLNRNRHVTISGGLGVPNHWTMMSHSSAVTLDFVPPWEAFLGNQLPTLVEITIDSTDEYDSFMQILSVLLETGYNRTLVIRPIPVGEEWGDYLVATHEDDDQTYWDAVLEKCVELEKNDVYVVNEGEWNAVVEF